MDSASFVGLNGRLNFSRGIAFNRVATLAFIASLMLIVAAIGVGNAKAAFVFSDWNLAASTSQAGSHPALTLRATTDAASADQTGDDLRELNFDLPAGMNLNPQSVSSPCSYSSFTADNCAAATQVGTLSVRFRVGSSMNTAQGSVYLLVPDDSSVLKLGFIVRPSNFQKLIFSSANVSGLGTVRDTDYGLSIRIASLPRTIRTWYGSQISTTIGEVTINLSSRSGSTGAGPYFTYNPTGCEPAESRARITSYRDVSLTRSSSFTPTGCQDVDLTPDFSIIARNTRAGEPTGIIATLTVPTDEQEIQQSHVQEVAVNLPTGMTLNIANLNAIPEVCSESQLAAASCPVGSRIGFASIAVPFLPSAMGGEIFLTGRGDGVEFGVVARGARGTVAIFRGSAEPADFGGPSIRTTFTGLPQVPFSSATLDFGAQLVNNPEENCASSVTWADVTGYSGSRSIIGVSYPLSNCIETPNTTIDSSPKPLTRDNTPTFSFSSDIAAAAFECSIDDASFTSCGAPYTAGQLADGAHTFAVRAVNSGKPDPTPAAKSFIVDTTPPTLTVNSPADGATVNASTITVDFSAEAGAILYCWLDDGSINTCASPVTYSGLADGEHSISVFARDAAGNISFVEHYFDVLVQQPPVVTIQDPVDGAQMPLDEFNLGIDAISPSGAAITNIRCVIDIPQFNFVVTEGNCEDGDNFGGFNTGSSYRLTVTATDSEGLSGTATSEFVAGIRRPLALSSENAPAAQRITDRTPTFILDYGDPLYPVATFECSLVPTGSTPNYQPCGDTDQLDPYTVTDPLANGQYTFTTRTLASGQESQARSFRFTVADWSVAYSATTSTQQAGAHPDLDVQIKPSAGQLHSIDMLLPRGLIGSLTAFPQCAKENVETAACPVETQVGTVAVDIKISGLSFSVRANGMAYLTEPQVEGDVAGLTLLVKTPIAPFSDVVIPLRIQLINNARQMRVFSETIPTQTYNTSKEAFDDFFVVDFKLHLNGSQGSPFPLLTNPTSCAADSFSTVFGDLEAQQTDALASEFTSTNCEALAFGPTISQAFSSLQAGSGTNVSADLLMPAASKGLSSIRVEEPPAVAVSFPSFGSQQDQCPVDSIDFEQLGFDESNCPTQAKVGSMSIDTPLFPTPIAGDVFLIESSPIPWLGAKLKAPGVSVGLIGATSTPKVDPSCNPVFRPCRTRLAVEFADLPDVPLSAVSLDLDIDDRAGANGTPLGKLLRVATATDATCEPTVSARTTFVPQDGSDAVVEDQEFSLIGCT